LADLEADHDRLTKYIRRVEITDLATASDRWKHHLGRQAFGLRANEEMIRVICILATRRQIEAGFSQAVQFSGEKNVFRDKEDPQSFGKIDWGDTLKNRRLLDDPEHFPIRVPGFTLVGGKITLDALHPAALYEQRAEIFRLAEYVERFAEIAAEPRCANCSKVLMGKTNDRRRYCSDQCSQAARQRAYRERQKAAILRHRHG
jgi:hypothetical protein